MPKRTRDYHEFLLEQLTDPVFAAEYLNEARQDSQKMFLKALRNVAESRRMAVLAEQTGLNRESLYKSLSEDGNPRLDTCDSVLSALGIDYDFKPKQPVAGGSAAPSVPSANKDEQIIAAVFEPGGNTTITSTASSGFRNVATVGDNLIFTNTAVTGTREQPRLAYAVEFMPGFIAH